MESSMIWTPVHFLISEAVSEHEADLRGKIPGHSLPHRIFLKLKDAEYLKEPEKPTETGKT